MAALSLAKLPVFGVVAEMLDPIHRRNSHHSVTPLDSCPILVDGELYDVGPFLDAHPGGNEVLLKHMNGKDVGNLMRGTDSPAAHSHSKAAFRMLHRFKVSKDQQKTTTESAKFEVDLKKPLVFQVGHLGKRYQEWVYDPIACKESPRFFESDLLETFTRTPLWVLAVLWLPVVFWMISIGFRNGYNFTQLFSIILIGSLIWTLVEYCVHRFVNHMNTSSYWTNTIHYLMHGFHHKHPMDASRVVSPPLLTGLFCLMFWHALSLIPPIPYAMKAVTVAGGLLGYMCHDLTHYFLHHITPFNERSRRLKRFHLNHHFKVQTDAFGISTTLWDHVFGTLPSNKN